MCNKYHLQFKKDKIYWALFVANNKLNQNKIMYEQDPVKDILRIPVKGIALS